MNPWPFIVGAYVVALAGVALLTIWSWLAMRGAEREAENLRRDREA